MHAFDIEFNVAGKHIIVRRAKEWMKKLQH